MLSDCRHRRRRSTRSSTIAGKTRGNTRVNALDLLAQSRPSDPALAQLLSDSLFSGRRDEASYAAPCSVASAPRTRARR